MTSIVADKNKVRVCTPEYTTSAEKRQEVFSGKKRCFKCKQWKLRTEFYANKKARDGLDGYCKKCRKEYAGQWHRDNRDHKREYHRNRYNKENAAQTKARHRKRHPDRNHARYCLQRARLKGLKLTYCSWANCRETTQIEGHHPSYEKPHEIMSLCRLHHRAVDLLGDKLGFTLPTIDISSYLKKPKHTEPERVGVAI